MKPEFETYRGFVYPWAIDHIGHMNVQFYSARFDEASWHFLARLGLTPAFLAQHGRGLIALDQRTQYKHEVLAGTLLDIRSELIDIGHKTLRYIHRMRNSESTEVVATTELLVGYFDTRGRKTTVIPASVGHIASMWLAPAEAERAESESAP
jgi:acyl-CoA thioester hydrolase